MDNSECGIIPLELCLPCTNVVYILWSPPQYCVFVRNSKAVTLRAYSSGSQASSGPGAIMLWYSLYADLDLMPGAGGFQVTNPSPFAGVGCIASLEVGSLHVHMHAHTFACYNK